jgi:hypothetical protein
MASRTEASDQRSAIDLDSRFGMDSQSQLATEGMGEVGEQKPR